MNHLKIETFDISKGNNEEKALTLLREAFHSNYSSKTLSKNTNHLFNPAETLHLAVLDNDEVIGFNSFTPHTFYHNNSKLIAYQMGWAAIKKSYRGKGLYIKLIETAKTEVKNLGGEFLFGFPNTLSHPIFIHKLGFSDCLLLKTRILLPQVFLKKKINDAAFSISSQICIHELEQYRFKAHYAPNKYIKVGGTNKFMWGQLKKKKGRITYFALGGLVCDTSQEFVQFVQTLTHKHKIAYIEIVTHPKNMYAKQFKRLKEGKTTQPFIIYDLQGKSFNAKQPFTFFSGIKDVF